MTTRRVLVSGASGFVGRHLCDYLAALKPRPAVIAVDLKQTEFLACGSFHCVDLTSDEEATQIIADARADYVIHLAGTFGTDSPQAMFKANVLSITTLLEAIRIHTPRAVVLAVGSAAEYGRISREQLPVTEESPCRPVTLYGLSKQLATQVGMYYHRVHNIAVMIVRPFQLIGPGITQRLAPGAFGQQLSQALRDGNKVIKVGNLESSRDFLDVHDAVEGIWMLCKKPAGGQIFNLCSGRPTLIGDLVNSMVEISRANVRIEVDPARLRGTNDVSEIYGSFKKLNDHCGWKPKTELTESITSMFSYEQRYIQRENRPEA